MKDYLITVQIETNAGEVVEDAIQRSFSNEKKAEIYASGFSAGYAVAHRGAVISSEYSQINDYSRNLC
jgi:hypothetical protein